ncbi:uncharacterized protein LOC120249377 [Dioscorea cayenensis subsp. rotundata]|uniref:Uncharacterized protein LOC120249377 n=1 Tax=Dioscorea cayennensis subsp. rotundata TaxID=55577 RepID=A0AB40AG52_DIOCR|nr:uncharacterized protein LOC120249377 [Dioscorea cayenensis subsp. rotundata]
MQKGLIHAVNNLLPLIEHRMCARHIYARWGKIYPGKDLHIQFWCIARSTSEPEVKKQIQKMKDLKGGAKAVEELLDRWPISGWCNAFFSDLIKCDVIDNNMCETFNGVILESRSKPIITMLEDFRQYVMIRIAVKRQFALKWKNSCGPNILARIEKERKKTSKWQVEWNGGASHEVFRDDLMQHAREGYVVMLACQSCSCGKWNKSGIPCEHALAVISFNGVDPVDFVAEWFKKETYVRAYSFTVNPVKGREFWPVSDEGPLQPPVVKKMPGRPVKKRRREPLEGKHGSKTKISRHGRVFKCTICHEEGHNKLRCPKKDNNIPTGCPQVETSLVLDETNVGNRQRRQRRMSGATQASKGKKKMHASVQGSGPHLGGVIVGRDNPQFASFITAGKLNALKSRENAANQTKDGDQSELTSIAFEDAAFPTQDSMTSATTQGKKLDTKNKRPV